MAILVYPLFTWDSAEDMSLWSLANVSRTAGQADPFGGTGAYLLNDTSSGSGALASSPNVVITTASANNPTTVQLCLKAGTAAVTNVALYDATAATYRTSVLVTWSGGVPSCTVATGSATLLTPMALVSGWYLIEFTTTDVASATNNHQLVIFPAGSASSTPTGTVLAYIRPIVLFDVLDDVMVWDLPRDGYEAVQGASGVEDAWWVGVDHHLKGQARWIPARATDTPARTSGWDGSAQAKWMNQGVAALLLAGAQKQQFQFIPNRGASTSDVSTACYMVDVPEPTREPNGLRAVTLHFRTTAARGFEAVVT